MTTPLRSGTSGLFCALLAGLAAADLSAASFPVKSPDGRADVTIECSDSALSYSLSWKGQEMAKTSALSLVKGVDYEILGSDTKLIDKTWKPTWGQWSEVRDHCQQLTVHLKVSGLPVDLVCQVYNSGVGFRFSAPADAGWAGNTLDYTFDFHSAADYSVYTPAGEGEPFGPMPFSKLAGKKKSPISKAPVVMDTGKGSWLAILESDLYSATLFSTGRFSLDSDTMTVRVADKTKATEQAFVTPWRVLLFGETPGDLLESTVTLNLAAPTKIRDTAWIKPGKGLWDWRIHGYDNGDFKYGIDTRSYLRMIDFASGHGIDYLTIDDHWFTVGDDAKLSPVPALDIKKVMAYAQEKGVKVILYYDRKTATRSKKPLIDDKELFAYYKSLGAYGMKYGFMGNKADFTREAIDGMAEHDMFIFFHDSPTPMTGVERTMPNLVSREYCHGQQDGRRYFTPTSFLKMAMINALTGPLDQSNGNFGINSINAGEREKGPRKRNSAITTVVSEVARCLVISSGLVTLPDAPEEYLKKEDLFEFLKEMPATWDDSKVLNSKMAETITTARRTGDTWFIGSVNDEKAARSVEIKLDFLQPGATYEATLFMDAADTDGVKNPESYKIEKQTVKQGDLITAKMALGGGHAIILRPAK